MWKGAAFSSQMQYKAYTMWSRICPAGGTLLEFPRGVIHTSLQNFQGWKLAFSGISSSRGFLKKVWKFKKLEQYKKQMVVLFQLCLVYAFVNQLHLQSVNKSLVYTPLYIYTLDDEYNENLRREFLQIHNEKLCSF